jgi:hypothetical protein
MERKEGGLALEVCDATRQKSATVTDVPPEVTVEELVNGLLDELNLPHNNQGGGSLSYMALLEREARQLNPSDRVGDVLQDNDQITLSPDVIAG